MSGIVVIIPVYNAATELAECLASLEKTLTADVSLWIADDASTQPTIEPLIRRFCQRHGPAACFIRRDRNLGFVGNVNRALAETAGQDVVLLNSDTVTTPGWLERLAECAASDTRIATATPWSNNAEICSFPLFCQANPVPENADLIAAAAACNGASEYPDLPTGVGFCLYMRRAALDAIGTFDAATFGRGYGEENDFCLRAHAHGWRNVLCDSAYVVHRGKASFGPEGHAPGGENLLRLNARYPDYNTRVAEFILRDPLKPLRQRLSDRLAVLQQPSPQRDLFV